MDDRLTLVVMMSALNEEKTIGQVIDCVPRELGVPADVKVVVVDDGSTDRTSELARKRGAIVIRHARRRGLGRSFAVGLERALEEGADIVVNIDADGQFDASRITDLIEPILEDRADFVTASRFATPEIVPEMPAIKKWGNRQMSHLVNFVTGTTDLTDVSCGFRAYNLRAALHVHLSGHFTHTHETVIDLADKGLRLDEIPMEVRGVREHGRSRMAAFLPRYALRAGVTILRTLCRTRPLFFFGGLAFLIAGLGVLQGMIVFANWWLTHRTHPFQSLLIGASLFIMLGFLIFVLGFLADMMNRAIGVSEKLLFFHKLEQYRTGPHTRHLRLNGRVHATEDSGTDDAGT